MNGQKIININEDYTALDECFAQCGAKKVFLVCDNSMPFLKISSYFDNLEERIGVGVIKFSDFQPNPLYESVVAGVKLFCCEKCDVILAVGGGSAMDVAKCIKLYSNMDHEKNYLGQEIVPNDVPLWAVPTTAGTGSEATRYAVIYYNGEKQSVADYSCIPSVVLMDASVLKTLPVYQKKSTMMDAFCHAIEAYWSVNSTDESKAYSKEAIQIIMANKALYLANSDEGNANMLRAANLAGKAINITQTTAGHAMCYKVTSLYGIAHGHAAALCVSELWPYMVNNTEKCIDPRGEEYLRGVFFEIAAAMGCDTVEEAIKCYHDFVAELEFEIPTADVADIEKLKTSVNPVRLKNNPVRLDEQVIEGLYRRCLKYEK